MAWYDPSSWDIFRADIPKSAAHRQAERTSRYMDATSQAAQDNPGVSKGYGNPGGYGGYGGPGSAPAFTIPTASGVGSEGLPQDPGNASSWLANYFLGLSREQQGASAAEAERQNAFEAAMASQRALAASNPSMDPGLAARVAAGNVADLQQQGARQATQLRAQEEEALRQYRLNAAQGALGAVGQQGQYSLGVGQLDLGNRELQQRAYDNEQQRQADEDRWRAELAEARRQGDRNREQEAENNLISAIFGVVGVAAGAAARGGGGG